MTSNTTAKARVWALSYGDERNDKDELLQVFDAIAVEWQRDKDELAGLRSYNELLILGHDFQCNKRDGGECDCGATEHNGCSCGIETWKRKSLGGAE